jgi:hypothetical protein
MRVSVQPPSVVRGTTTAVTVNALDADSGAAILNAIVILNGAMVGGTGHPFNFSPAAGLATAAGVVQDAPAYKDATTFSVALTDPAPPPQRTIDVNLALGGHPLLNGLVTAQNVQWKVVPEWGTKQPVTKTGNPVSLPLPAPPSGLALVQVFLDFTVVANGLFKVST